MRFTRSRHASLAVIQGAMAKILFTWELGGGIGHLTPYLPMAEKLVERGHRLGFAVRDLSRMETVVGRLGDSYLQAPLRIRAVDDPVEPACSYAHILHNIGYSDPESLTGMVRAWRELYGLAAPDLLVCDHSPTALLAAVGTGIPTAAVGFGFFIPPDVSPLPPFRAWSELDAKRLADDEQRVLDSMNLVLGRLGAGPLERLSQLFQVDAQMLLTFAELDHYPQRGEARYLGTGPADIGEPPDWPEGTGKRIFAYLKPFESLSALLRALNELGNPTIVYGDGIEASTRQQFASRTLHFADRPQGIPRVAQQCDLAIMNGNHGTAVGMLLAGKPSLHIPLTAEQHVFAERVVDLGAGLNAPMRTPAGLVAKLNRLLESDIYTEAARAFASRHAGFDLDAQATELADSLEALLRV